MQTDTLGTVKWEVKVSALSVGWAGEGRRDLSCVPLSGVWDELGWAELEVGALAVCIASCINS